MDHDSRRFTAGSVVTMRHCHRDVFVRNRKETRVLGAIAAMTADRLDDRREIGARIGKYVVDSALAEPCKIRFGSHFLGGFVSHGLMSLLRWSGTLEHVPFRWKRDMLQPFLRGACSCRRTGIQFTGTGANRVQLLSRKPPFWPEMTAVSGKFDRKMSCGVYECPITSDRVAGHIQARRPGWKPRGLGPGFPSYPSGRTYGSAKPLRASRSGHRPPECDRPCRWG